MWLKMAHFDMIRFFISDLMIDIDSTNNIPKIFEAEIPIMYECRHGIRAYKYRQYILDSMLHACMHACTYSVRFQNNNFSTTGCNPREIKSTESVARQFSVQTIVGRCADNFVFSVCTLLFA